MEFNSLVAARRSVRAYRTGEISKEQILQIIACAQNAPSWKNSQTARYYVACTPQGIAAVREALPSYNAANTQNASAYIVTTFVKNRSGFEKDGTAVNENGNEWGAYDLGLAASLLLLKAKELGFDSLIMGLRDSGKLREKFSVPDTEEVVSVIALGHGDIAPERPKRKDVSEITKFF